jgi:restriction system protein
MRDRNPLSPWNPSIPTEISPSEFEKTVLAWLRQWRSGDNPQIEVEHLGTVEGAGGEYEIDVLVKINVLGGAVVVVLVECKHQGRPVEREDVLVLEAKLRDVAAHKGMLFSTSGFQKGALQYATAHGIATIAVVNGSWLYETKSVGNGLVEPPPWVRFDPYAGIRMTSTDTGISCDTINLERIDALKEWFAGVPQPSSYKLRPKPRILRSNEPDPARQGRLF